MNRRKKLAIVFGVAFLAIQAVPYGHQKTNPPVVAEPDWDRAETREMVVRACFDCHSNQTKWPWYTYVAPMSWLAVRDVLEGREHLNFSEWHTEQNEADEAGDEVREGEMPMKIYLPLHPEAVLSAEEREALADGLDRSLIEKEIWD